MADISRIKISEEVYDIKDSEARYQLELLLGTKDENEQEDLDVDENASI